MVKVISINVRGISSRYKKLIIQRFLQIQQPDILLMCETQLRGNHQPKFDGYIAFYKHRPTHGGGVAILIKQNYPAKIIDTSLCQSFEICGISSSIGGNKISFYSKFYQQFQL